MKNSRLSTLIGLLLSGLVASACATGGAHYYDGSQRRSITLQPDLVAQFVNGNERSTALGVQAVALPGVGDSLVRIYRLSGVGPRATVAVTPAPDAASPVFREGNSPAGRLMALPGGVLVKFKPDWTRERIDAWLAARSLAVTRKLEIESNWFVIATPKGNASLTVANQIFESGEVLAATPNWWKQTVPR